MAANPPLVEVGHAGSGRLMPALFAGERLMLERQNVQIKLGNVMTKSGSWKSSGTLFLSDVRLVFVCSGKADASGLQAFDLPLAYVRGEAFNQPIFGANNISGEVWPATPGGGPFGSLPPHKFSFAFNSGGVGTFLPLWWGALEYTRSRPRPPVGGGPPPPPPMKSPGSGLAQAFVDPSDPTTVYVEAPNAPEMDDDKKPYEPMELLPEPLLPKGPPRKLG